MSLWEIYTWFAVAVLIAGPVVVALFSIRDLRAMWRARKPKKGSERSE